MIATGSGDVPDPRHAAETNIAEDRSITPLIEDIIKSDDMDLSKVYDVAEHAVP